MEGSGSSGEVDGGETGPGGPRFDLGDGGPSTDSDGAGETDGCVDHGGSGGGGAVDFTFIWIANTVEGTVSKIDTRTAIEVGRFRTGPDVVVGGVPRSPDPSRTSVNLHGDAAVTNRTGSVVKIAARVADCVDVDGSGTIETSTGPTDVLAWGLDECVLWRTELGFVPTGDSNDGGPRGTAWDPGSGSACVDDAKLWVGFRTTQSSTTATLVRLNGDDGSVDQEVVIPDWSPGVWGHGPYGAASDRDGNLWALGTDGFLVRVDGVTLDFERFDMPEDQGRETYGIAIASDGAPWIVGFNGRIWRFDTVAETFAHKGMWRRMRGVAIDAEGRLWAAGNGDCSLVHYDTVTDTMVSEAVPLPECDEPVGVSIDVDGFVWVVDRYAERAYKVDPGNYQIVAEVAGLRTPYTYSDMTGFGLSLVVGPPG